MPNDVGTGAGPGALLDIGRALELLAASGGLVGPALASAGLAASALETGGPRVQLTLGAVTVFDAARRAEDRGLAGAGVLASATTAARRFLDLVPDAVLAAARGLPAGHR